MTNATSQESQLDFSIYVALCEMILDDPRRDDQCEQCGRSPAPMYPANPRTEPTAPKRDWLTDTLHGRFFCSQQCAQKWHEAQNYVYTLIKEEQETAARLPYHPDIPRTPG